MLLSGYDGDEEAAEVAALAISDALFAVWDLGSVMQKTVASMFAGLTKVMR